MHEWAVEELGVKIRAMQEGVQILLDDLYARLCLEDVIEGAPNHVALLIKHHRYHGRAFRCVYDLTPGWMGTCTLSPPRAAAIRLPFRTCQRVGCSDRKGS